MSNKNKLSGDGNKKSLLSKGEETRSLLDFCKGLQEEEDKKETLPLLFQLELSVANLDRNEQIQLVSLLRESPLLDDDQEMKYLQIMLRETFDLSFERKDHEEMQRLADLLEFGADRTERYQRRDREQLERERLFEELEERIVITYSGHGAPPPPASFLEEETLGSLPHDLELEEERACYSFGKRKDVGKRSKIKFLGKRSKKKSAHDIPDSTPARKPVAHSATLKLRAIGDEPDLTTMLSVCRMRAREIRSMQKTSS